jgi:lipopolysaccharide export system protein LptC
MKHWGSALFPLSILLVLTLLTFWLRYATELSEPNRDGKHRHDPDYILSDIVLRKLDQDGELKYTLRAVEVRHYPDDDTTDLLRPNLLHQNRQNDKPPVMISADRGHVSNDNERVDLYDNVRIYRQPFGKYEELTATMDELTAFPDEEKAFTKTPVLITQGTSWVKGVGMKVDNKAQTYVIESQAVGFTENKKTNKNTNKSTSKNTTQNAPKNATPNTTKNTASTVNTANTTNTKKNATKNATKKTMNTPNTTKNTRKKKS